MNKQKKIKLCSLGLAGLFLAITLIVSNQPVVMSSENSLFKYYEYLKFTPNENSLNLEDSVVLVNTHYSMKIVKEQGYGNVAVVDRDTLYAFLQYLKNDSTYRYIILDVIFDRLDREEKDTALYNLISSMPRIVIAMPEDGRIADTCLIRKAGEVGYNITSWESDFVKYPFIQNGDKSLALKMYEELYNDSVKKCCFFYWNKGFMRRSATLTYSYTDTEFIYQLHKVKNGIDIGVKDKYILVGDFNDDVHTTFMGDLPGPIINFNAYMTLVKGYHRVGLLVLLILFVTYFFLVYQTLVSSKFTWLFMWIGYPVFLATLNFVIYYLFNEIYDVLVTTSLFFILKTIVESYRERNLIRERISTILQGVKQLYVCFKSNIIGLWKK